MWLFLYPEKVSVVLWQVPTSVPLRKGEGRAQAFISPDPSQTCAAAGA